MWEYRRMIGLCTRVCSTAHNSCYLVVRPASPQCREQWQPMWFGLTNIPTPPFCFITLEQKKSNIRCRHVKFQFQSGSSHGTMLAAIAPIYSTLPHTYICMSFTWFIPPAVPNSLGLSWDFNIDPGLFQHTAPCELMTNKVSIGLAAGGGRREQQ